jgi:hypothetical protein
LRGSPNRCGAFGLWRNPSAHHEIEFDDPREVVDMICHVIQLLQIIGRPTSISRERCRRNG